MSNKLNNRLKDKGKNKQNINNTVFPINKIYLIPLIIIIAVVPLIMKLKDYNPYLSQLSWYSYSTSQPDFFLYYKQWVLVSVVFIMLMIIVIRGYVNKNNLKFSTIFIPLAIYGVLALLSAIFAISRYHSFMGSLDLFESVLVLIGYCLIVYYAYLFIKSEDDVRFILKYFVISILIMCILGFTQFIGHDFFATELGTRLVTSKEFIDQGGSLKFNFTEGRVYLTLFNPNYVGVYVSLVAPIVLILLIFSKKLFSSLLYVLVLVGLIICEIGSQSLAGIVGLAFAAVGMIVFMWRYLLKRFYIVIPLSIVIFGSLYIASEQTNHALINKIFSEVKRENVDKNLTEVTTLDDSVAITYKGNRMFVSMDVETSIAINIKDADGKPVQTNYNIDTNEYYIEDDRFSGITYNNVMYGDYFGFYIKIDGIQWYFTNLVEDGTYYIINRFGKLDKAITPPDTFLKGYEEFASKRGFIWSRTLPILKDYIFLGAGPDNFIFAYPQQDYVGYYNYFPGQVTTKPHSMYLQIAVQTGIISLIAFLVFYIMYFISSFSLYIKGRFNSFYSQVGVAIFVGSIAYMIVGITSDSSVTTAPVFWTLIGIGIVCNEKARPLIMEEIKAIKEEKQAKKAQKNNIKDQVATN